MANCLATAGTRFYRKEFQMPYVLGMDSKWRMFLVIVSVVPLSQLIMRWHVHMEDWPLPDTTTSVMLSEVWRNVHHCYPQLVKTLYPYLSRHPCNRFLGTSAMHSLFFFFFFFDVRVFPPNTQSYHHSSISSLYHRYEQDKKEGYDKRSWKPAPLAFATTGGLGREANLFYKCLADKLSH